MPQTLQADSTATTRSTEEQFIGLLCADEEMLRAEFDAIIAAEWPEPPPAEPASPYDGRAPAERPQGGHRRTRARATGPVDPVTGPT